MSIVTTSNRGQIVIPKAIRNKLQIGPGKKLSTLTLHKLAGFDFQLIMLLFAMHRENAASLFELPHLHS